jgi:hypothetical protein
VTRDDALNSRSAAIRILSHKKANWAYACEWRVLGRIGENGYADEQVVAGIYFGSRIPPAHLHQLLRELRHLRIDFFNMSVEGYKHVFKPLEVEPPHRRRKASRV